LIFELGEFVNIKTGKLDANAAVEDGAYPFFTCAREISRINDYAFDTDAILVAGNGDLNVKHYKGKFNAYQRTYVLDVKRPESLDSRYLYYFMDQYVERLRQLSIGGVIKYIKLGMLTEAPIPLPALEKQERIAAILDKADAIRRKRQHAIELTDQLLRSVFLDMFGDPVTNPKGWPLRRIGDLASKIGSGATPRGGRKSYVDSGIALIRSMNIHDDEFVWNNLAYINADQAEALSNVEVASCDVLLNITGASVCRCAIVEDAVLPARVNQHVSIIRPISDMLKSEYLLHTLIAESYKAKLLNEARASGATREALTKNQISDFPIPVPPIDEQERFTTIVRRCSFLALKGKESLANIGDLSASLAQRAFPGDLVREGNSADAC